MTGKVCPFMSTAQAPVLCNEGKIELASNVKDAIRQQAKGQIVDFDMLVPKEPCMAWQEADEDYDTGFCLRLC